LQQGCDVAILENQAGESQSIYHQRKHFVSISLSASTIAESSKNPKKLFSKKLLKKYLFMKIKILLLHLRLPVCQMIVILLFPGIR
jgi:hypothetical protein